MSFLRVSIRWRRPRAPPRCVNRLCFPLICPLLTTHPKGSQPKFRQLRRVGRVLRNRGLDRAGFWGAERVGVGFACSGREPGRLAIARRAGGRGGGLAARRVAAAEPGCKVVASGWPWRSGRAEYAAHVLGVFVFDPAAGSGEHGNEREADACFHALAAFDDGGVEAVDAVEAREGAFD